MGEKIGYARVSSVGQNLEVQQKKLSEYGCTRVYEEKVSGLHMQHPQLKAALAYAREGDSFVITRLDRLGRSVQDLCEIVAHFRANRIDFMVIDQHIDTSTSIGLLMFQIFSAFAEFEANIRAERQREGIDNALEKGIKFGRKRKLEGWQIFELRMRRKMRHTIPELGRRYNLGKTSVYRYLDEETIPCQVSPLEYLTDRYTFHVTCCYVDEQKPLTIEEFIQSERDRPDYVWMTNSAWNTILKEDGTLAHELDLNNSAKRTLASFGIS